MEQNSDLLPFISNTDLYQHVSVVLQKVEAAKENAGMKLFSNVLDPFSALFDITYQGVSFEEWLAQEKSRQTQKTLQNAIGSFHQSVIGSVPGWQDLGVGVVADVVNEEKRLVAEIKNKHNTTKGNHKTKIYEDLRLLTTKTYPGFTSYYVEIIPKNCEVYDKPFTPSNNRKHKQMARNGRIRVIDGKSFYALATGYPNALRDLYRVLPKVIADIQGVQITEEVGLLTELFSRAYGE